MAARPRRDTGTLTTSRTCFWSCVSSGRAGTLPPDQTMSRFMSF
jgi:hypothetical protein